MNKLGYAVFGAATILAMGVVAQEVVQLRSFSAGEPVRATEINTNFTELERRITAVANGPRICGVTPVSHPGRLLTGAELGYAAAGALCRSACDSPTAHLCDDGEARRSLQAGGMPVGTPRAWISGFGVGVRTPSEARTTLVDDCGGFTIGVALDADGVERQGSVLRNDPPRTDVSSCDASLPLLCCDFVPTP